MNNELFLNYHFSRKNLVIILNYYDFVLNKANLILLVREPTLLPNLSNVKNIKTLITLSDANLEELEVNLKNTLIAKNFSRNSSITIIKNNIISQETSLIDTKKNIANFLSTLLETPFLDEQLYIEEWNTRRPMENYLSANKSLELDITKFAIEVYTSETTYIDDILLKNVEYATEKEHGNILGINVFDIIKLLNAITQSRDDLLEKREELSLYLRKYWLRMPEEQIANIIRENSFSEDYLAEKLELLDNFDKLSKQEGEFNELLWNVNVGSVEELLNRQDINFNGFILENKENLLENNKKLDTYSIFKYFELNENIPFSRYSYGNQINQKIVKIFENFYSIENLKFLEQWSKTISYKDTPNNCIQWMGFYNLNNEKLLYELILFADGIYQIRLYQQKMNLKNIEKLLEYLRNNILLQIKTILSNIGINLILEPLELGRNIYFVFSKLEINLELNRDILLGRLQNVLGKSIFVFNKLPGQLSNEFTNLEFKKVNNFTRTDQVLKYITHYIIQGRINPKTDDMTPLVKQLMTKYRKNVKDCLELINNWVSKFMSFDEPFKKSRMSKSLGLELIGKQMGSNSVSFYMTNVTELEDINTFFYYISMLLLLSQTEENNALYKKLIGVRLNEKLVEKVAEQKEQEEENLADLYAQLESERLLEEGEKPVEEEGGLMFDPMELLEIAEQEKEASQTEAGSVGEPEMDILDLIMGVREQPIEEAEAGKKQKEGAEVSALANVEAPIEEEAEEEPEPIINGASYYIRRLQQMDKEVYDYKIDSKFKPYSKKAMPNDSRQPIIITNRQMNKILERYGDDKNVLGGIHPESPAYADYKPSYSIKYRNLHYICPKVWCMYDQMPFYLSDLIGAKVGYNDKGEYLINPNETTCPICHKGVWDKSKRPDGSLLIAQDNLGRQPYPGFFPADQHPKNLCMVACFKRPNQKLDECLEKEGQVVASPKKKIMIKQNEKNILKGDKYGNCSFDRYCECPKQLHNWLNSEYGESKLTTKITDGYTGILRRGVLEQNDEYYHSFEKTLKYLLGESTNKLSKNDFRKYLVNKLKETYNIEDIFRKCRKGSLYLYFDKNIDNYYNYVLNTMTLQPKFILPLFGSPNVLNENGVNFYVIREENEKIYLECEYLHDSIYKNGIHMFIYTHSIGATYKKTYYEPLVLVQHKLGTIYTYRSITNMRIVKDLWKYAENNCREKEDPWISQMKRSRNFDDYFIDKQSSKVILNNLKQISSEFLIISQYVNEYNQTEGLIIKWIPAGENFYLPIQPITILDNIAIIENKKLIKIHNLDITIGFLNELSEKAGILYTPQFYTENDNGLISGVITITGNWIPTLYIAKDVVNVLIVGLNRWNITRDDWFETKPQVDSRVINRKFRDTRRYNYEKLRYELSGLVNRDEEFKEQILDFMRRYKPSLEISEKTKIRADLTNLLSNYLRTNLVVPGVIGNWNVKDIFNYCPNNETLEKCNASSMCVWKTEKCRFVVNPEWYWKYVSKITDELLVNINKKYEIIQEYRKELSIPENEILFFSKEELDDYLEKYDFNLENKKYLYHPLEHFNYSNPKKVLTEEYLQKRIVEKTYKIPTYLKELFVSKVNPKYPIKDLNTYVSKESNNNYFFSNIEYLLRKLEIKSIPIRDLLAKKIRLYKNPLELLEKYKRMAELDDIYSKFNLFKTVEALADYVRENSWASLVDLELLANILSSQKIRFIIIEDTKNPSNREIFVHLPDHLRGMTKENLNEYTFVVFMKHDYIFELVQKKDNPIFSANELEFINAWLESQVKFETRITY